MMHPHRRTAGSDHRLAVLASVVVSTLAIGCTTGAAERAPDPNRPSRVSTDSGPDRIVIDTTLGTSPVRLLWLAGRPASPSGSGTIVEDGVGGVVGVSDRLMAFRAPGELEVSPVSAVAAGPDGATWVIDGTGTVSEHAPEGAFRRSLTPRLPIVAMTVDRSNGTVWLVRSSARFTYRMPGESSPLFERLRPGEAQFSPIGRAQIPDHAILADLNNAGHLVARGDTVWYAPFIRDELLAMTADGDTIWSIVRGLPQTTDEPRFELDSAGRGVVDYHPVNLGLQFSANGNLMVVSSPDGHPTSGRLDEIDPASGAVLATVDLNTAFPTLASDGDGRVYSIDAVQVVMPGGVKRVPLPAFALPTASGDSLRSTDLRGTPTVLNFWATWCAPCRRELPALDTLRQELSREGVRVIGMNDDRDSSAARRYIDKIAPDFPYAIGLGNLQREFAYIGLPWTVLVGSDGQVIGRWIGELLPHHFRELRRAVAAELRRVDDSAEHPVAHH